MALLEFCRGRWGKVVYATQENGVHLAAEFFDDLSVSDQAKLAALFKRFADCGEIKNREKFKKIADNLFEFKSGQIRMFCFLERGMVVVTHGCIKKKDALNKTEIKRAERIRFEHKKIYDNSTSGTSGVQRSDKK
ncbi:MAG TPA: type II toxin-antitoxin system RelE/ParE family toxin [Candidatus Saccharimonadales bacterium]|nr:type II toxin-antitoxin system RelE/ParE family toxin [Candidatus Saccharimonadales bacterium]